MLCLGFLYFVAETVQKIGRYTGVIVRFAMRARLPRKLAIVSPREWLITSNREQKPRLILCRIVTTSCSPHSQDARLIHTKTDTGEGRRETKRKCLPNSSVRLPKPYMLLLLSFLHCVIAREAPHQVAWTRTGRSAFVLEVRPRPKVEGTMQPRMVPSDSSEMSESVARHGTGCRPSELMQMVLASKQMHDECGVRTLHVSPLLQADSNRMHSLESKSRDRHARSDSKHSGESTKLLNLGAQPSTTFKIVLVVTSAAAFPASSKACFLDSLDDVSNNSSRTSLNCTLLTRNDHFAATLSAGQLRLLPAVIEDVFNGTNGTNSSNATNTTLSPPQNVSDAPEVPLGVCAERSCIFLQILRYDAWDNSVNSSDREDVISLELEGIENSVSIVNVDGISGPHSDGAYNKIETAYLHNRTRNFGNTSCRAFACNVSQLVLPEQSVLSWLVVRMNGLRLGHGAPFLVETPSPPFYSFLIEEESLHGSVAFEQGLRLRALPCDRGGTPLANSSWFGALCGSDAECRAMAEAEAVKMEVVSAECFQDSMGASVSVDIDFSGMIFEPECVDEPLCPPSPPASLSGTPVPDGNSSQSLSTPDRLLGNATNISAGCVENCTWNRRSLVARFLSNRAARCAVFVKFGERPVFTPVTLFNGSALPAGMFAVHILAGLPNATTSELAALEPAGAALSRVNGSVSATAAFEAALILRDAAGNHVQDPHANVIARLRNERDGSDLSSPLFDSTLRALRVTGAVTVAGTYQLQIYMEPFAVPLDKSPFEIYVAPGRPVAANSIMLQTPETAVIDLFGQFFFQARDAYHNAVRSTDAFFDPESYEGMSPANKAPGYWIWAVPLDAVDESGAPALPQLDSSGAPFLHCPGACDGEDPGQGSFKAAFRPTLFADYYVEVQYCDPAANAGGVACNQEPLAYNLTLLQPPVAPNPCTPEPTGEPGGARAGYACTIPGMSFVASVLPDRIVIPTSEVEMGDTAAAGRSINATVRARDRANRDSGQPSSRCRYTVESLSIQSGECTLNTAARTFSVHFVPPFAGEYALSVWLNGQVLNNMPARFTAVSLAQDFAPHMSTAVGRGLSEAAAGRYNDVKLFLRDTVGSVIVPEIEHPIRGSDFIRDCGYPFPQLPDGTVTSGYGLADANTHGLDHGCRLALHTYVVDARGDILRAARGFQVASLTPTADGSIAVRYSVDEAGPMLMFVRYLPTEDAGRTLHDPAGALSLESKSTARQGQIHGSPFRLRVSPDVAAVELSRVYGPGLVGAVLQSEEWARFQVESRDRYDNQVPCRADEVEVAIADPDGAAVAGVVIEGAAEAEAVYDCQVWYSPVLIGKHSIAVKFRGVVAAGSPFQALVSQGPMEELSASNSVARVLTSTAVLPCYQDQPPTSPEHCPPQIRAGDIVRVSVSVRDRLGRLPQDSAALFTVQVHQAATTTAQEHITERTRPGEHQLSLLLTVAGSYMLSVPFDAGHILFHPHAGVLESVAVTPAETSAAACELVGFGLSISTAGFTSHFRIIPKDKFGNLQYPPPSPDPSLEEPGKGIFQVSVLSQGQRTTPASVVHNSDGSLTASWPMTVSGQFQLTVSMLDFAPTPLISQIAVSKSAVVESQAGERTERGQRGQLVSRDPQPFVLTSLPGPRCAAGGCGNALCGSGSVWRLGGLDNGRVTAGAPVGLEVLKRDACGNQVHAAGGELHASIYGPLTDLEASAASNSQIGLLPQGVVLTAGTDMLSSSWTTEFVLTQSGRFAVGVDLDGVLMAAALQLLHVDPATPSAPDSVLVTTANNLTFARDDISFAIEVRDMHGNLIVPGDEVVKVNLFLGDHFIGQPFRNVHIDRSPDRYDVSITDMASVGDHTLQVMVDGRDIRGSPFVLSVEGGNMSASKTFATIQGGTPIPQTSPDGEQRTRMLPTDELQVLVYGRDDVGAPTRRAPLVRLEAFHDTLGNITANVSDLVVFRSQGPRCTHSNFGDFCDPQPSAEPTTNYSRSLLVELMEDGTNELDLSFQRVPYSKCRSLSGFEEQETLFDNTVEIFRYENVTEGNDTFTVTFSEFHATSYVNFTHCRFMCVTSGCTCATHINGTGTFRDGTCILLSSQHFFEQVDAADADVNRTTSFVPAHKTLTPWYASHPLQPLRYRLRCQIPGRIRVDILVGGVVVHSDPLVLQVSPSVLDPNASSLAVVNAQGATVFLARPGSGSGTGEGAVAGGDFVLLVHARDAFGNDLCVDPRDNKYRIQARLASSAAGVVAIGTLLQGEAGLQGAIAGLDVQGQYDIQLAQGPGEYQSAFPLFNVFSSPLLPAGATITFETVLCLPAACSVRFLAPHDVYGNEADLKFSFWRWDTDQQSYQRFDDLDTSFARTRQATSSYLTFNIQVSGDFQIWARFYDGSLLVGSPFLVSVSSGATDPAMTSITGAGSRGAVVNDMQSSTFRIETRDSAGNPTACVSVDVDTTITDTVGQAVAVVVSSPQPRELFCRAQYLATAAQTHTLTVQHGGTTVVTSALQIMTAPTQVDASTSSASCFTRKATDENEAVTARCTESNNVLAAGDSVFFSALVRDRNQLLPDMAAGLEISIAFCETEDALLQRCTASSPASSEAIRMQQLFPGEYEWNATMTRSGSYLVTVHIGNSSTEYPSWAMTVRPGESAFQTMMFEGSGLDKAVVLDQNTFVIVDNDIYGNARVLQEALHVSQIDAAPAALAVSAKLGTDTVDVSVSRGRSCQGVFCVSTAAYSVIYTLPTSSCGSSSPVLRCSDFSIDLRIQANTGTVISTSIPVHQASTFVPGASLLISRADSVLTVGQALNLTIAPNAGYVLQVPLDPDRLEIQSPHGPLAALIVSGNSSSFSLSIRLTVSGEYAISVLDGGAHLAGSPLAVTVTAGEPVANHTTLVGYGAYASFVNSSTTIQVLLYDQYGNPAETSKVGSLFGFLTQVNGTAQIEAQTSSSSGSLWISFIFRFPGSYLLSVSVNGEIADGGLIVAGSLQSPLTSPGRGAGVGSEVLAMVAETVASKSVVAGQGLTLCTAGAASTFTVLARDAFSMPRTTGGDIFGISLDDAPASCAVDQRLALAGFGLEYAVNCRHTRSGTFMLQVRLAGVELAGTPLQLTVSPGPVSAPHCYLQQTDPVVLFGSVGNLVVSATSDVEDGAFVRTVGNNSFTLILQDASGNLVVDAAESHISVFVVAQHVRLTSGLLMWNEGEQPVGNVTLSGGSSTVTISANISDGPVHDYGEDPYAKWAGVGPDGDMEVAFLATKAGKYRLHVLVNGLPIRRHLSVAEMQAEHRGDVVNTAACCLPVSAVDSCPGSGSVAPVCGELVTLLPEAIDVEQTRVSGSQFKQFRSQVDGDGEGHEEYPIFTIRALDRYGNIQTESNVELLVSLIDINGTLVHQSPAASVQPTNPQYACRVSELEPTTCGQFQYQWSSITSSRSGMYLIHVAFNGTVVGPERSFITVRSRGPETLESQIFGPGLQVNVGGEPSYFYFRVFDVWGNAWEPDSTDDKPVNVDMGLPTAYGLNDNEKLYLDTVAATPRTKLIYHGYGLFQVQYMAWRNQTNSRGNFQMLYSDKKLAIPGVGRSFVPLTLGGPYEQFAPVPLVPDASSSFATGSALYNHFAGDEVEVTVHALSLYPVQEFPTGFWPAVEDEAGKSFVVEVQGPPGAPLLRFSPERRTEFRWQLQAMWVPTVAGEYIVSVEYDKVPVQGDPSTPATVMPASPWVVAVRPAPVDPRATVISGPGTYFAVAGDLATFRVQTRDLFGNAITGAVYNRFQEDPFVNASLLASVGPVVVADTVSLADGSFRVEYVASRSGAYALTVMVNGVTVSDAPAIVEVAPGLPELSMTRWSLSGSGREGELCHATSSTAATLSDHAAVVAGQIRSVSIELRDAFNNSAATGLSAQDMELQLVLDSAVSYPIRTVDSTYASTLAVTQAGEHAVAVLLLGQHLSGSPWTMRVAPSDLYGPNCISIGLEPAVVGEEASIVVHGYDFYHNSVSMQHANISFAVVPNDETSVAAQIEREYSALLLFTLVALGEYTILIDVLGGDGVTQAVQGSGTRISALPTDPPLVSWASFMASGAGLTIRFDRRTDMACMYETPHTNCGALLSDQRQACCWLFAADSCAALGEARSSVPPLCWWKSPFELAVHFGSGATVQARQVLRLRDVVRNQAGTSVPLKAAVQMQPRQPAIAPHVVLVAQTEVGPCDTAVFDAALSSGGGGRPLQVEWTQFTPAAGSEGLEVRQTATRIALTSENFTNGSTEISVAATNYYGNVGGGAVTILKQSMPGLGLIPLSGVYGTVSTSRASAVRLQVQVQHSTCSSLHSLSLQWELVGRHLPVGSIGANTSNLEIQPYSLDTGLSHEFRVNATALVDEQTHVATTSIRVAVQSGRIRAVLVGVASEVPETAALLLDASASDDDDRTPAPMQFRWSCAPVLSVAQETFGQDATTSTEPCFFDRAGVLLRGGPLLDLSGLLSPDTYTCLECVPGMYKVSINVSKPLDGRWSVAHALFRVVRGEASAPVAGVIPLDRRAVSTSARLRFKSVDVSALANTSAEFSWSLASGQAHCCLGVLDLSNATLFPMGVSRDYLIVKPGLLLPGATYAFQVHIRTPGLTPSVARFFVDVSDWPAGGSFAVQPTAGTAADTAFTIACLDWTDDTENLPLMYEFAYVRNASENHPIALQVESRISWRFPTGPHDETVTVFARVHNRFSPGRAVEATILVRANLPASGAEAVELAEGRLTGAVDAALERHDVHGVFQHTDLLLALLNHQAAHTRRVAHSAQHNIMSIRSAVEARLGKFAFSMPFNRVTLHAMATSLEGLTRDPLQLNVSTWLRVVALCHDLAAHDSLVVDNDEAARAIASTLSNVLEAAAVQSRLEPSTDYLREAAQVTDACRLALQRLSIAQLSQRVPEDENLVLQTAQFVSNSRRIFFHTAFRSPFGPFSTLPSQPSVGPDTGPSFRFTPRSIDMLSKRYPEQRGPFVFGTRPYPRTEYSAAGKYPQSTRNVTLRSVSSRWFGPVPASQRAALRTHYLDVQIVRWRHAPFVAAERQATELNWGSSALGRVAAVECSSALTDCSERGGVCRPPVVEGSQGPDYPDLACHHALNQSAASSWAVDPAAIADPAGAGSTLSVRFVRPFILTMVRYQQRRGPKYCTGSSGVACETSSGDCECIAGGDRRLSFAFDDGSEQTVELQNSYSEQLFHLHPVTTASVVITVLSVYSNPKTCPPRSLCAWWNPTCLDWCPNGAQAIQFLSTAPDTMVYDTAWNYMLNFSAAAAVISPLASVQVRQEHVELQLSHVDSPIVVDLPEQPHTFTLSNDTLVTCRSFDRAAGRWSNRGVIHTNRAVTDASGSGIAHTCHAFQVAVFGLVLVRSPYQPPYPGLAVLSQEGLAQNLPSHWLLLGVCLSVLFLYLLSGLWVLRRWLLAWMAAEVQDRARYNEYIDPPEDGGGAGRAGAGAGAGARAGAAGRPTAMPFYFPALTLAQSTVVAAQAVARGALFRMHLRKSFGRWHYLYALTTPADDIVVFARLTCLCCLVLSVLALSAVLISDRNTTTAQWHHGLLRVVCVTFPFAQLFPALFRLISLRHVSFDRFEDTDVYHGPLVEAQPVYGPQGTEKKTRLSHLKRTLGPGVLFAGLKDQAYPPAPTPAPAPAASVCGEGFGGGSAGPRPTSIATFERSVAGPARAGRYLGDREESAASTPDGGPEQGAVTTMGSIRYFVRKQRLKHRQTAALATKVKANQVAAHQQQDEEEAGGSTLSGSGAGAGAGSGSGPSSDSGVEGRVAIAPEDNPTMLPATSALPAATTPREGARLRSAGNTPSPPQTADAALPTHDHDQPRPPPRVVEPLPAPPPGLAARLLNHVQERELLRRRRRRELASEVLVASRTRRWALAAVLGRGEEGWSRGTRPLDKVIFPRHFRWLAYLLGALWATAALALLLRFAAAADNALALAWLRLSALSLAVELALTQSLLAFAQAWWLCFGRAFLLQQVARWCLARTDLLPPMG